MKHYTFHNWLEIAKNLSSYKEVEDYFVKLNLIGKTIKSVRIIGMDYFHSAYRMGEWWLDYCDKHNIPLKLKSEDEIPDVNFSLVPDDLKEERIVELDEPIIIEFTDGQCLELLADEVDNIVAISFNEIPSNAKASINYNNIDGNVIFSSCLGKKIKDIRFISEHVNKESVPTISFILENGINMQISGWADYFDVWLNKDGDKKKILPITWGELKKGLHN